MKNLILLIVCFAFTFAFSQFLVGSTGLGAVFDYGHANGFMIYISVVVSLVSSFLFFLAIYE